MTLTKHFWAFFNKKIIKKLIAYLILILVIYLLQDFLGLFLLSFIFWYLAVSLATFLKSKSDLFVWKYCNPTQKRTKILKNFLWMKFFIIIEYILFIAIIFLLTTKLIPNIIVELGNLSSQIPELKDYKDEISKNFSNYEQISASFSEMLKNNDLFSEKNLEILQDILWKIKDAWWIIIKIFLALILSFAFIIDLEKLKVYFSSMKKTSFSFFYEEYSLIITTVVNSFWKVFKAQAIIALVNTILTIVWLIIIWWFSTEWFPWTFQLFPFIYTLAIIVFIAWFIPVVWTFISSIPIIIIAIAMVWWLQAWIVVLVLISVVHAIEAYYLNPKIVSSFMKMPISLTFLILIISHKLMWIAGLIVWVSLFNFFEELFKDIDKITKKTTRKLAKKI